MMVKAICEFVLRRDIPAAHKLITRCRSNLDNTWRYSRAFLHAYQGKMEEAVADYKHAFNGPIIESDSSFHRAKLAQGGQGIGSVSKKCAQ
jgi:major membrane immunogen (membrane-anchored lipoprotein)